MTTFFLEPARARLLATELLDAASSPPATPFAVSDGSRYAASLLDALVHLEHQTRRVHDRARVLGEHSTRVIETAEASDDVLAADLGRLA